MKTAPPPRPTPWMTSAEAAVYARCSVKTIARAVAADRLRHVRLAGTARLRFRSDWLDRWLSGDAEDEHSDARQAMQRREHERAAVADAAGELRRDGNVQERPADDRAARARVN
jgi:excisionase family DNA binding protein